MPRAAAAAWRCRKLQGNVQGVDKNHSPTPGEMGITASAPEPYGSQREMMVFARVRWRWGLSLGSRELFSALKKVLMPLCFPTQPHLPCGVLLPSRGCVGSAQRGIIFLLGSNSLPKTC